MDSATVGNPDPHERGEVNASPKSPPPSLTLTASGRLREPIGRTGGSAQFKTLYRGQSYSSWAELSLRAAREQILPRGS